MSAKTIDKSIVLNVKKVLSKNKEKVQCVGAVKIATHGKVNDEINAEKDVYSIPSASGKTHNYYKQCAKYVSDGKLCNMHSKAMKSSSSSAMTFEQVIKDKNSTKLGKKDLI